jgi:hypothetical protein
MAYGTYNELVTSTGANLNQLTSLRGPHIVEMGIEMRNSSKYF